MSPGSGYVDGHVHVAFGDKRVYPINNVFRRAPQFVAPIEEFRTVAGALGVTQAVLIQPSVYAFDHSYLMRCLAEFPRDYVGVALVDPLDPGSPDLLNDLVRLGPVTGVRLGFLLEPERGWLDPVAEPLARAAADLGLAISILGNPAHLALVDDWLNEHQDLTVVIDHLGHPELAPEPPERALDNVTRLARFPRTYVKLSALPALSREPFPHRDTWHWARTLIAVFGVGRCMWGSDFPFVAAGGRYLDALTVMSQALPTLSPSDRSRLLAGTAREAYRLPLP